MSIEKISKCIYNNIGILNKRMRGETQMAVREKNIWILLVFLLSGLVIGGLLGEIASSVPALWWLSYGQNFRIINTDRIKLKCSYNNFRANV